MGKRFEESVYRIGPPLIAEGVPHLLIAVDPRVVALILPADEDVPGGRGPLRRGAAEVHPGPVRAYDAEHLRGAV